MSKPNAFTAPPPDLTEWAKKLKHARLSSVAARLHRPPNNDIRLPGSTNNSPPGYMRTKK